MTTQPPLDWKFPIVDPNGTPTVFFQRVWNQVRAFLIQSGMITLTSGTVPDGWHLCDGTNGTPNLPAYSGSNFIMKL